MIEIAKDRPPYVTFEFRAEEDREASIAAGHYVSRDIAYALITPMGSKDRIERVAEEWLAKLAVDAQENRFPAEWLRAFRGAFEDWKAGRATPVSGTAIENWPPASPSQVKTLLDLKVRTVEDLSMANEETLARIGMGGRSLKQKAIDWLAAARDVGKLAEDLSALRAENSDLRECNSRLEARINTLLTKLEGTAKAA
jgi:hypothetical protein